MAQSVPSCGGGIAADQASVTKAVSSSLLPTQQTHTWSRRCRRATNQNQTRSFEMYMGRLSVEIQYA
jgi:hypothetical protein